MSLIIGIFISDSNDSKEIIFASDGRAVKYKNNKKIEQNENVEKIRKFTHKICLGYVGKNAELFEDVYEKLKNGTPEEIKNDPEVFAKNLQKIILKVLKSKKHRKYEKELEKYMQLYRTFIAVGLFQGKLILIRLKPDDKYKISKEEVLNTFTNIAYYVAGATDRIQKKTEAILDKKLGRMRGFDEVEKIIKFTFSEVANLYPDIVNKHIFIRRLSKKFDL